MSLAFQSCFDILAVTTSIHPPEFAARMIDRRLGHDRYFRWQGGEVSRLEGFSDATYAFAVTLLVVSLEVPRTFHELLNVMRGFLAFGICFAFLIWLWYSHYLYFRRYGLQDVYTIVVNSCLLFVVLFYVYPLKFLFGLLVDTLLGFDTDVHLAGGIVQHALESWQGPTLMVVYGVGFVAVQLLFFLLYQHAYIRRKALDLNAVEILATKTSLEGHALNGAVGLVSVVLAAVAGGRFVSYSWYPYMLIGVIRTFHGVWRGKRVRTLASIATPEPDSTKR